MSSLCSHWRTGSATTMFFFFFFKKGLCNSQDFHISKKAVQMTGEAYRQGRKNSTLNSSVTQLPSVGVI